MKKSSTSLKLWLTSSGSCNELSKMDKRVWPSQTKKKEILSEFFSLPIFLLYSRGLFTVFSVKFSKTINFQAFLFVLFKYIQ